MRPSMVPVTGIRVLLLAKQSALSQNMLRFLFEKKRRTWIAWQRRDEVAAHFGLRMRTPDEHCYSWWLPTSKSQTSRYGVGNTFLFISFVNAWIFKQSQRSESSFRVVFRDKKCRLMMSLKFFQLRYGVGNTFLFISFVNAWIFKQSRRSESPFSTFSW